MKPHPLVIAFAALIGGCSSTPNYDAQFGNTVRDAKMAMIINPNAGSKPDPVAGLDGQAAKEAQVRYLQTFKEPPPVVNVINIGGAIQQSK